MRGSDVKVRFLCVWIAAFSLLPLAAYAQQGDPKFPSHPITFINPVPAGAASDLCFRMISKEAEKFLGQPIVVINKTGGSFTVGIAAIATSKPDGYTIGYAGHPGMFVPPLTEKVPYHPVNDLREIMQFGIMNIAITVKGDSPFKSWKDIVAYARQNPKKLTYGSAGVGSFGHLALEQIARKGKGTVHPHPVQGVTLKHRLRFSAATSWSGPATLIIPLSNPER